MSVPVTWEEVEAAVALDDPRGLWFTADEARERLARAGDLLAPALASRQVVPDGAAPGP